MCRGLVGCFRDSPTDYLMGEYMEKWNQLKLVWSDDADLANILVSSLGKKEKTNIKCKRVGIAICEGVPVNFCNPRIESIAFCLFGVYTSLSYILSRFCVPQLSAKIERYSAFI